VRADRWASLANSARAQLSTCSASASQQFRFSQVAGGYYNIVNAASGKCLDVQSKSTANGAAIIQYTCNGGTNQQWSITTNTNGSVRLTARHSGKSWRQTKEEPPDGTYIVQWAWSGAAYQQFQPATGGTGGAGGSGGATSSGGMTSSVEQQAWVARRARAEPRAQAVRRMQAGRRTQPERWTQAGRRTQPERWTQAAPLLPGAAPGASSMVARRHREARRQAEFRLAWEAQRHRVGMLLWLQPISTLPTERRRSVWKAPLCSAGFRTTRMGMRFSLPINTGDKGE